MSIIRDAYRRARLAWRTRPIRPLANSMRIRTVAQERLGSGYGGWVICLEGVSNDSIIYSFGVGEDISFDLALIERFQVKVHTFDPTPRSIAWVKSQDLPPEFLFHDYGLLDYDGTAEFFAPQNPGHVSHTVCPHRNSSGSKVVVPVRRLDTIMKELGHQKIDILKMDIEGSEYPVIEDLVASGVRIKQLLVEFHDRFDSVGCGPTRKALDLLNRNGFRVFSVSPTWEEFSFIHI